MLGVVVVAISEGAVSIGRGWSSCTLAAGLTAPKAAATGGGTDRLRGERRCRAFHRRRRRAACRGLRGRRRRRRRRGRRRRRERSHVFAAAHVRADLVAEAQATHATAVLAATKSAVSAGPDESLSKRHGVLKPVGATSPATERRGIVAAVDAAAALTTSGSHVVESLHPAPTHFVRPADWLFTAHKANPTPRPLIYASLLGPGSPGSTVVVHVQSCVCRARMVLVHPRRWPHCCCRWH